MSASGPSNSQRLSSSNVFMPPRWQFHVIDQVYFASMVNWTMTHPERCGEHLIVRALISLILSPGSCSSRYLLSFMGLLFHINDMLYL